VLFLKKQVRNSQLGAGQVIFEKKRPEAIGLFASPYIPPEYNGRSWWRWGIFCPFMLKSSEVLNFPVGCVQLGYLCSGLWYISRIWERNVVPKKLSGLV